MPADLKDIQTGRLPPPSPKADKETFSDEALILTDAPVPGIDRSGQARSPHQGNELWIETARDEAALIAIEPEWEELARNAVEPNAFYEPWMLRPALRAFGGGKVEVVLVFAPHPSRAKGKRLLCGLFPVVFGKTRAELWRYPYCYLTAPLLRRGVGRSAVARFFDYLRGRAPFLRMQDVPGDGEFRLLLVDEIVRRRWPALVSETYTRAVLRRAGSAEEFLDRALAGKRRKELRRQRARLAEQGVLETLQLGEGEDPQPWLSELLTLEARGWKGKEGVDGGCRPAHRIFLEEMAREASSRRRLHMMALRLDGKPVAVKLNLVANESAFAFKIAFDEDFARFSPGVLLELDNVRAAHEMTGLRVMDSCAAPNRFMINHLWPDRREMQTVFISTGGAIGDLVVSLLPLLHFIRARIRRRS